MLILPSSVNSIIPYLGFVVMFHLCVWPVWLVWHSSWFVTAGNGRLRCKLVTTFIMCQDEWTNSNFQPTVLCHYYQQANINKLLFNFQNSLNSQHCKCCFLVWNVKSKNCPHQHLYEMQFTLICVIYNLMWSVFDIILVKRMTKTS